MDRRQFDLAAALFENLGSLRLSSGKDLKTALCMDDGVSLWDIIATYMVLYRFPLLFSSKVGLREHINFYLRPYRGMAMNCIDSIVSLTRGNDVCEKWNKNRTTALFLGFVPTFYRDVLHPVAEKLVTKENVNVVVIGQNKNKLLPMDVCEKLCFQTLLEHKDKDVKRLITSMLKKLKLLERDLASEVLASSVVQDSLCTFGKFALRRELHWLFSREFRRLIPQLAIAIHVLDKHRPTLIVSADDADQRCRIYSLLAKKKNVPTLLVQQGLSNGNYPEWRFFTQDIVAAMGETSRLDMISQGVPAERVVVTGHPGFDQYASIESDLYPQVRSAFGLRNDQKMILFASQPYYVGVFNNPDVRKEMIRAIVNTVAVLKNVILIVKPHPGESVSELKKLIGEGKNVRIVNRTMDIACLVKACDVLVTFFSTVALQALYAGKPVINVNFHNSGAENPYLQSGATWVARSVSEFAECLNSLTGERKNAELSKRMDARDVFLRNMIHVSDGRSAERVVGVVKDILKWN